MPTLTTELFNRLRRKDKLGAAAWNIPIAMGKVTMDAQTKTVTIAGLLSTDIVIASPDTKDSGAVTAVEYARRTATDTLSIKTTVAPSGNNGIIAYAVFRPQSA